MWFVIDLQLMPGSLATRFSDKGLLCRPSVWPVKGIVVVFNTWLEECLWIMRISELGLLSHPERRALSAGVPISLTEELRSFRSLWICLMDHKRDSFKAGRSDSHL